MNFDVALDGAPCALDQLIAAVTAAADAPLAECDSAVAAALRPFLARADLLDGRGCTPRAERYARHLLHADPASRFAILALVWTPGQASPIHAHRAWCAFGVHRGTLTESYFDPPTGDVAPVWRDDVKRLAGECGHDAAGPGVHRLANRQAADAVSIHVYGVAADAIETGVNRVYG